jgi:hypothetical protein
MDGDLLLRVTAGYSSMFVIRALWLAFALSADRARHRHQLDRYGQMSGVRRGGSNFRMKWW